MAPSSRGLPSTCEGVKKGRTRAREGGRREGRVDLLPKDSLFFFSLKIYSLFLFLKHTKKIRETELKAGWRDGMMDGWIWGKDGYRMDGLDREQRQETKEMVWLIQYFLFTAMVVMEVMLEIKKGL